MAQGELEGRVVEITETEQKNTFTETTFKDVSTSDWYYDSVKYVYENGIMEGTENGFEPQVQMTRAMLVTVLYRMEKPDKVATTHTFTDVYEGMWYTDAVIWAYENGIVKGVTSDKFCPDDKVTREQTALILYRYAKEYVTVTEAASDLVGYTDVNDVSDWALDAVKWAHSVSLINGTSDSTISPKDTATRAQVSAILMRLCELVIK